MYEPGTVIAGKYRLEEQIGEGGSASIWRAVHSTLKSSFAVKLIQLDGSDVDVRRQRFLREAQLAASVSHRCVVDIVDFGQTEDGQPYMVMELLTGETLAARMTREPALTVDETVRIFDMLLGGLAAIHDKGVVHRDLKPENIFLSADEEGVLPKLTDFGISRVTSRASQRPPGVERHAPVTKRGHVVGTPQYMSPEQARALGEIDQRSDIFAMGTILYETLARRKPFDGASNTEVLLQVIEQAPPPLVDQGVDPSLAEVVEMAMAKDKEDRFRSVREMRMALRAATRLTLAELNDSHLIRSSETRPASRHAASPTTARLPAEVAEAETLSAAPPPNRNESTLWLVALMGLAGLGITVILAAAIVVALW